MEKHVRVCVEKLTSAAVNAPELRPSIRVATFTAAFALIYSSTCTSPSVHVYVSP